MRVSGRRRTTISRSDILSFRPLEIRRRCCVHGLELSGEVNRKVGGKSSGGPRV